jgi:predicted transcriptional regulator
VEALVQERAVSQLHNALAHLDEWGMSTRQEDGFVRALFFKKEECDDGLV